MKSFTRAERISNQVKRELSEMIQRNQIKDDRISGMVSIVNVSVSNDLRNVKVSISVYGDESDKVGTLAALESASGFIKGEIGRRLRLRFAPEFVFKLDSSLEEGDKVLKLLNEIKSDNNE